MYLLLKMMVFHCYVCLPEGKWDISNYKGGTTPPSKSEGPQATEMTDFASNSDGCDSFITIQKKCYLSLQKRPGNRKKRHLSQSGDHPSYVNLFSQDLFREFVIKPKDFEEATEVGMMEIRRVEVGMLKNSTGTGPNRCGILSISISIIYRLDGSDLRFAVDIYRLSKDVRGLLDFFLHFCVKTKFSQPVIIAFQQRMQIELTLTGWHDSWFMIQCFVLGRHASKIQCLQANQKMMHQMKARSICGLLLLWPCWCRNMASISYPTKHNTIRMGVSDNFYRICDFVSQSSVFCSPRSRES